MGSATYHALQAQSNKRFSTGLSFLSNYTFSKAIDNVRSAFGDTWGANGGRPPNYYNLSLDKSISDSDRTHTFKIGVQYELPFGPGRRFGGTLGAASNSSSADGRSSISATTTAVGRWESTGSGTPNSNFAVNPGVAMNPEWSAAGLALTAKTRHEPDQPAELREQIHQYVAYLSDPISINRYQRGNTSYRLSRLRGPWELSDDFSLQKNFRPMNPCASNSGSSS